MDDPNYPFPLEAPRGLSAEEKRVKLLEIFHETVSCVKPSLKNECLTSSFTEGLLSSCRISIHRVGVETDLFKLKELEKLGPKMKGIGRCVSHKECSNP